MNPAATLSKEILSSAFKVQASDIHFYPFPSTTKIYFRIHGHRIFHRTITSSQYKILLAYYKFTSGMDIGETRKPQNGVLNEKSTTHNYSLRLSVLPLNGKESLAIRILPQTKNLTLDQLFIFPYQLHSLKQWISHRAGLILFSGPTGCGKTTTLYALLQTISQEKAFQTITIEDPIEKTFNNLLQVQINEKAGITYQTGLKAALRHDPDIIMIGEIRDPFTAQFALDASLTGHLVLSTIHAKNTIGTVHRLLEMGLNKGDLSQSLIGVASLQLLPLNIEGVVTRRAAILEILERRILHNLLNGGEFDPTQIQTFHQLRKKAYAYGFISEKDL